MHSRRRLCGLALLSTLFASCGSTNESAPEMIVAEPATGDSDASVGEPERPDGRLLDVSVRFTADPEGVPFPLPTNATLHIPPEKLVGAPVSWATIAGGEHISNADLYEFGSTVVGEDLSFVLDTRKYYATGPWEIAVLIHLASEAGQPAQPGDLASFAFEEALEGDPAATGVTGRINVTEGDGPVRAKLENKHFIEL